MERLAIDLQRTANLGSRALYVGMVGWTALGYLVHPGFYIGSVITAPFFLVNIYFKHIQTKHTILRNFGILGAARYILESIGPEMRQYFYMSDNEERPFNRTERAEVYRKSKDIDSASSFGSLKEFNHDELKIKHSFFPVLKKDVAKYKLTFGEERGIKNTYTINKPFLISAMSFGALGENAVRSLARGAKQAGIAINTGEGGYPKYHLMENPDIIFQMGTAKFGVRNLDGSLNDSKLKELSRDPRIKMIEIKLSQGAKPGKGGLLPKEKVTKEISELRGVPMGKDVISPERHIECTNVETTVKFIKKVQDISELPVGIKFCLGDEKEFEEFVKEMKKQDVFPDYIAVDGAEGGTGAAPKSFMDDMGIPIMPALDEVHGILCKEGVRKRLKIIASGKLINPGKQIAAMNHGADAIYTARGFMLAMGCIQALQCNKGSCPVGITTHDKTLQRGLIIEEKAIRVANYVKNLDHEFYEILSATGSKSFKDLRRDKIYERKILARH